MICRIALAVTLLAAPALAQTGAALTACEVGTAVIMPGPEGLRGTITQDMGALCLVQLDNGEIGASAPFALTRAEGPGAALPATPTEGIAALVEGYWTCRGDGVEPFDLYLAEGTYATMDGGTGTLRAEGDALSVVFADGPFAGTFGTVSNAMLMFAPPGLAPVTCRFKG
jgi:hypothetical protein